MSSILSTQTLQPHAGRLKDMNVIFFYNYHTCTLWPKALGQPNTTPICACWTLNFLYRVLHRTVLLLGEGFLLQLLEHGYTFTQWGQELLLG